MPEAESRNIIEKFFTSVGAILDAPTTWVRDKLIVKYYQFYVKRFEDCVMYESPDAEKCTPLYRQYEEAATNWFIKYGDLGAYHNAKTAYMKQKHRLIWERRHGPVGCGVKSN
ncbi:hypothetical protein NQ314_011278 [Rhamnusium bicolor]|uniref:NADH dehydrogenase [ubiquinone] 1 beta subcomplex subunit 10 n=1 Tax=Rhamnusium bicolor TaxID=1586634 RepID=A0AAV8XJL6_9CUCU|nr:hypothetical protein NQ314_011278 [Rhamnusium bicolor]